jgi:hypothetical protein
LRADAAPHETRRKIDGHRDGMIVRRHRSWRRLCLASRRRIGSTARMAVKHESDRHHCAATRYRYNEALIHNPARKFPTTGRELLGSHSVAECRHFHNDSIAARMRVLEATNGIVGPYPCSRCPRIRGARRHAPSPVRTLRRATLSGSRSNTSHDRPFPYRGCGGF